MESFRKSIKIVGFAALGIFLTLFTVIGVFAGCIAYESNYKKTEVYTEQSPDGCYTLRLYEVGDPVFPFGPVTARIVIEDARGKTIDACSFELNNDGGHVRERNLKELRWLEGTVEADVKGAGEDAPTTHILQLQ